MSNNIYNDEEQKQTKKTFVFTPVFKTHNFGTDGCLVKVSNAKTM